MQEKKFGALYAPKGKISPVCRPGEFPVGVIGLDHGHIYGMCSGLSEAGAEIAYVYDPDPAKTAQFRSAFPAVKICASPEEVLTSPVKLIASASIPSERCAVGAEAMRHGKDFFGDKPAVTTRKQLALARRTASETGRRFFVYFSERLHVEASVCAEELLKQGVIGKTVHVMGCGPHRLSEADRPEWFFDKDRYGGILVDIGCHQIEQLLFFSGADDAEIVKSRIGNYAHHQYENFQDFGDCMLQFSNGVSGYFRVDWFTPDGLGAWGDGRTLIVGTDGYIEIRKYTDLARDPEGDHVYWADGSGEHRLCAAGRYGFPFFGQMIRDCLTGTEKAGSQKYIFRVMELAIEAQEKALYIQNEIETKSMK